MEGKHAFERADWDLDLPSLKPLGLNCLLNTHVSHSHALAVDKCIEARLLALPLPLSRQCYDA